MNRTALAAAIAILLVAAFSAMAESAEMPIGWIGPLTGNAAVLGIDSVPAAQIAIDEVNATGSHRLKLLVEDDRYEPRQSLRAYQKLVHSSRAKVLIIVSYGGLFALSPLAERDDVVLIDPLDCDEEIAKLPPNTLCIAKTTEDLGRLEAEEVLRRKSFPVATIYFDGDPFMGTVAKVAKATLYAHSQELVYEGTYNNETTDFKPMLLSAKAKAPRAILLLGYDQIGLAVREARDLGMQNEIYATATSTSPGFRKLAGEAIEGVIFPDFQAPRTERYRRFLEKFKSKMGRGPNVEISTIPSYDTIKLIAEALRAGAVEGGEVNLNKLRNFLLSVHDYDGLSGKITIDPDGITRSLPVKMVKWKEGKVVEAER